jgi:hypothetical protein
VHFTRTNQITKMLPGRTDNAVKNRFHATCRQQSRKDSGDDEKLGCASTGFEGYTDSDSVEGEPSQMTPRVFHTDLGHDIKNGPHADLFTDDFTIPPRSPIHKTSHGRDEKNSKSERERKKKKVASSDNLGKLSEQQAPQDTASLNEHYIAKLNEYFAAAPAVPPTLALINPVPVYSAAKEIIGQPAKPLHKAYQPLNPQNVYNMPLTSVTRASHYESNLKRAKCSASVMLSRPLQQLVGSPHIPLGQPPMSRIAVQTTAKVHGVAFHELSLRERLAPAQSHSPIYTEDFKMNITSESDLDLEGFMFDDWITDETQIIDSAYVDDVDTPCCQIPYEWTGTDCTSLRALGVSDIQGCFSSNQPVSGGMYDGGPDLQHMSFESRNENQIQNLTQGTGSPTSAANAGLYNTVGGIFCAPSIIDIGY